MIQHDTHHRKGAPSFRRWLAAFALAGAASMAMACPGDGGPPCAKKNGAPAAQATAPSVNTGAGNPISVITGNKYQREEDMAPLPGVLGLEIVRHYNSQFSGAGAVPGLVGRGWKLSYETSLVVQGGALQVFQADGTSFMFHRDLADATVARGADPSSGTITIERGQQGAAYRWQWLDGRELQFDAHGKLVQIRAATGESLSLLYDARGLLVKVTDPQGRSLRLVYFDRNRAGFRGVQAIEGPLGRFEYDYGAGPAAGTTAGERLRIATLARVRHVPSGESRAYHYEDARFPTLLTGISLEAKGEDGKPASRRYARYGYDGSGKAVLSAHAHDAGKVQLAFERPGLTTLTNSLGQKTSYRYATIGGEFRLTEVRGAGCATCAEPNQRYDYDKQGRLVGVTKIDAHGVPLEAWRAELDHFGRLSATRREIYRAGRAAAVQPLARYEYGAGASFGPTLVARRSVVQGREATTRYTYNAAGQVLSVTERGWAPAMDGAGEPRAIERRRTFAYRSVNGRSVLVQIDGPLPNGPTASPADSDIQRVEWDAAGNRVAAVTTPGGDVHRLEYDAAGRVARVTDSLGGVTTFGHDSRGRLADVTAGGVTRRTGFDLAGNPVEQGDVRGGVYRAATRSGYDDAGRNIWNASALGVLQRQAFDTEGRLQASVRETSRIRDTKQIEYDAAGRLRAVTDASGGVRQFRWNAHDLPDVAIDALGREQHYRYDETGQLEAMVDADGATVKFERDARGGLRAVQAPNGAATRYVVDDFGRRLAVQSPDSGIRLRHYDAAGRIVASSDALGHRASYHYDVRGRLVKQVVRDADASRAPLVTEWRYEGRRLAEVRHASQSESYRYDDAGRLATRTVALRLDDGKVASSVTEYAYDEAGRLAAMSLPDGSRLAYRRNGQGQVVALERERIATPWLRWLAPAQVIVRDLERDLHGIRRIVYGNGIEALRQRSAEGVLAGLSYRSTTERQPTAGGAAVRTAAKAGDALLERRYLWDLGGNLLATAAPSALHAYGYDTQDRLVALTRTGFGVTGATRIAATVQNTRYFYDAAGNRVLGQEPGAAGTAATTARTAYQPASNRRLGDSGGETIRYDAAGQPAASAGRAYTWNAMGQLTAVALPGGRTAAYRYNHRGERIGKAVGDGRSYYLYEGGQLSAELDRDGRLLRQYLYLGDQPVAIIDARSMLRAAAPASVWDRLAADLRAAWAATTGAGEGVHFVHVNHLGAPEVVSDGAGRPVWEAEYQPFGTLVSATVHRAGGATKTGGGFRQPLRLPGQYEDEETGLYYNHHRYYDPRQGRYLTPDPLGLRAGLNGYAYVSSNPLKYVDPDGLVLFAFDGTGNDETDQATLSNVVRFRDLYSGDFFYITGPGTTDPKTGIHNPWYQGGDTGDVAKSFTGKERIAAMINYFDTYAETADDTTDMDVDIVGFSRGAAQARDFANQIVDHVKDGYYYYKWADGTEACQKVNFRFMGLFDTVLSTHSGDYRLTIPDAFKKVAHATALNEYRGSLIAFPLESILNSPTEKKDNRTEMAFLGAHSDIGGGFPQQDLAKIALAWMVDQAKGADVKMSEPSRQIIANPVIHDKSENLLNGAPGGGPTADSEDREVRYGNGDTVKQRQQTSGGMTYAETTKFIKYLPNPLSSNNISATVDVAGYLAWLNAHGYNINMKVN